MLQLRVRRFDRCKVEGEFGMTQNTHELEKPKIATWLRSRQAAGRSISQPS
jgi:hypothetical protein